MNILFVTSELTPYAKTGGLGDVLAALPSALRRKGHSISVALPLYQCLRNSLPELQPTSLRLHVMMGATEYKATVWQGTSREGVTIMAIQKDEFFDRSHLYGNEEGDYFDNASRFIFFQKAVCELARYLSPKPQILHVNDWQASLLPLFVQTKGLPFRTVLTIHNLAYQGIFPAQDFELLNLSQDYFTPEHLEYYGHLNFLKGGILHANQVTTVSRQYAKEIQTETFGCGLQDILKEKKDKLHGIPNGIDTKIWNPAKDPYLAQPYDVKQLKNKTPNKKALLETFKLKNGARKPLIGSISRLVDQKGVDIILSSLEEIIQLGANFVFLGSGDTIYENELLRFAQKYPKQIGVKIGFDEKLAHLIEAGCDLFVMPSRFEPCGLNQMYSQRYGTVPIVHNTGGLADSVEEWNSENLTGTGFKCATLSPTSFISTIKKALDLKKNKKQWDQIRKNGMTRDFSWDAAVPQYEEIYQKALGEIS